MSTIYRGYVKTNEWTTRDMISPSVRAEVSRGSVKKLREIFSRFVDLMRESIPHDGARALFEISDRYGVSVTEYRGVPDRWRLGKDGYSKVPAGGTWTLTRASSETERVAPREVRGR